MDDPCLESVTPPKAMLARALVITTPARPANMYLHGSERALGFLRGSVISLPHWIPVQGD